MLQNNKNHYLQESEQIINKNKKFTITAKYVPWYCNDQDSGLYDSDSRPSRVDIKRLLWQYGLPAESEFNTAFIYSIQ